MRKTAVWASVVVLAAAASLTIAGPAQAVPGLQYVTGFTTSDSTSPKAVTVYCPGGTAAIGGGAYLTGATGGATMRQIRPFRGRFGGYGIDVVAEEDPDGFAGSWSMVATAVCVPTPAGLTYVSVTSTDPAFLWVTADCGVKRVIGSGYSVSATAVMMWSAPQLTANRAILSVEASQLPGAVVPVTGTAIAVCADAPLPGLQEVHADSAQDSSNGKTAFAVCPAGTQIVGVGAGLWLFRGHTIIDDFVIGIPDYAFVTGFEDQAGNPNVWAATASAICAS